MKLLLVIFLTINTLFAIGIDKTWFDNTNEELQKIYDSQIKKISDSMQDLSPEQKEQLNYQKILLKKILLQLNTSSKLEFEKPNEIKNVDAFISTVKNYLQIHSSYELNKRNYEEKDSKQQTLEDQISKITDKEDISTTNSQILYALYYIENKKVKEQEKVLEALLDAYRKSLLTALQKTPLKTSYKLSENIAKSLEDLEKLSKDKKRISLLLDKAVITENQKQIDSNKKELEKIEAKQSKVIEEIVFYKVRVLITPLKNKKSSFFELNNDIEDFTSENDVDYNSLTDLFKYLSREHIGITKSTFADTKESFIDILKFGWNEINKPYIPLGEGISILEIIEFLCIFIIGFFVATFYRKRVNNAYLKINSVSTRTLLANLGYYFLVFITFVFALKSVGIDLSSLTILVGALSVGIGFGLQNIVSNFISGIILIFEKSIQVGNIIEIDAETKGRVTQINMRSSVINTFDNIDVIIPNSTLMQNNVINWTFGDDVRRLNIPFGVAYGTNAKKVIKLVLEELENSNLIYIKDDMTKMPNVWMTGMGASSVDFKLLVWIHTNTNRAGLDSSNISDFLIFVYETLNKHEIEIPFPQMDVHLKKELEEVIEEKVSQIKES